MSSGAIDVNLVLITFAKTFRLKNPRCAFVWFFFRYVRSRLHRISSKRTKILAIPEKNLEEIARSCEARCSRYVDEASAALGKLNSSESEALAEWFYVCSKITRRKYKILVIPYDDCESDRIIVSEAALSNITRALGHDVDESTYFVMPASGESLPIAAEASVSMISNPHDCSDDLIDRLLENYFARPRYLRAGDLFGVDTRDYAAEFFYSSARPGLRTVCFKVNFLRVSRDGEIVNSREACYVVRGETTLTQASHVSFYLPREFVESAGAKVDSPLQCGIEGRFVTNCPPLLEKPLHSLQSCIAPFLQKDFTMRIRPVFLVKGEPGSGKFKLIQTLAKRNGLNLFNVDFADVQSMSAAQTEAKLRIALRNARNCVPCILRFSNIQIFGKNPEGQKDERIVSALATELKNLNAEASGYPVIVIATLENDELDADINRLFIERVSIEHPGQAERAETLSWLLRIKGIEHRADLTKIAASVSDFRLADLESLIMQAIKIAYQTQSRSSSEEERVPLVLEQVNLVESCEKMQSAFNDRVGAPRIPKVYWDDIGGLANLKHEIKRRIELPMLEAMGLGRSGLLLYGPPGTGKTLLAKAVATECQLHFMSVKGPELLNMYVGQSEKNIRQVFERARAAAPCVIFFDELDSLAPNRGRSGDSGGVMDRVVSQLLAEMDGLESSGSVFIIGATNRPDLIDPALLRPGRFDKMLYVGIYSDGESQLSVLRAVTRRFNLKNNGDELEELVKDLPANLTGADLYAVCSDAWLLAVRRNIVELEGAKHVQSVHSDKIHEDGIIVELRDFVEAARNLVPSVSSEEIVRYEKLRMELSTK